MIIHAHIYIYIYVCVYVHTHAAYSDLKVDRSGFPSIGDCILCILADSEHVAMRSSIRWPGRAAMLLSCGLGNVQKAGNRRGKEGTVNCDLSRLSAPSRCFSLALEAQTWQPCRDTPRHEVLATPVCQEQWAEETSLSIPSFASIDFGNSSPVSIEL